LAGRGCATEIDIKANFMEYDETSGYVFARDSVTVTWEGKTLKAENVKFWPQNDFMTADTSVTFAQADSVVFSDSFVYDFKTSTGSMNNASGVMYPWFFKAEKATAVGEKKYEVENIKLTTCDLYPPHYYIRARHAKIELKKKVTVYNPVFYIRNVPVLYLPIYTASLKGAKYSLEVEPGYNSSDGFITKVIFGYPFSPLSYGKLYLDYYQKRGWGKGAEYNYFIPDRLKASIYGYQIKENTTGNERWQVRGGYWQKIDPLWTGQLDLNFQSDNIFNSQYVLDNWQRNDQTLTSNLSFTRQSSKSNFRITAERIDISTGTGFVTQTLTLPNLQYTMFPWRSKAFPYYVSFTANLQNQYLITNGFYTKSGGFDTSISKDYRIGRNTTVTPQFGINESWADHYLGDPMNVFITRYYNNLNTRYRAARWMDWDFGYNYRLRSDINSLAPEFEADDYGEDTKLVFFRNSMYVTRKMTIRNSTGYDFRILRSKTIDDWRQKLQPLVNELTYLPKFDLTIYVREESNLYPITIKSLQTLSQFGDPSKNYINFGFFFQENLPGEYDFTAGFGFWPTSKWKLDFNTRTSALDNFNDFRTTYYEAKVYRDLHCWEFSTTFRRVGEVSEVFFKINLKASSANRNKIYNKAGERDIYPWRQ
jgi:LPS-assembly protein